MIDESAEPPEAQEPAADTPEAEASAPAPPKRLPPPPLPPSLSSLRTTTSDDEEPTPRVKPAIPGADLEVDIVAEGADPLAREDMDEYELAEALAAEEDRQDEQPVAAVIDLASGARYRATGKRKTAVARVILKPGNGAYTVNGKPLDAFFPRPRWAATSASRWRPSATRTGWTSSCACTAAASARRPARCATASPARCSRPTRTCAASSSAAASSRAIRA